MPRMMSRIATLALVALVAIVRLQPVARAAGGYTFIKLVDHVDDTEIGNGRTA